MPPGLIATDIFSPHTWFARDKAACRLIWAADIDAGKYRDGITPQVRARTSISCCICTASWPRVTYRSLSPYVAPPASRRPPAPTGTGTTCRDRHTAYGVDTEMVVITGGHPSYITLPCLVTAGPSWIGPFRFVTFNIRQALSPLVGSRRSVERRRRRQLLRIRRPCDGADLIARVDLGAGKSWTCTRRSRGLHPEQDSTGEPVNITGKFTRASERASEQAWRTTMCYKKIIHCITKTRAPINIPSQTSGTRVNCTSVLSTDVDKQRKYLSR